MELCRDRIRRPDGCFPPCLQRLRLRPLTFPSFRSHRNPSKPIGLAPLLKTALSHPELFVSPQISGYRSTPLPRAACSTNHRWLHFICGPRAYRGPPLIPPPIPPSPAWGPLFIPWSFARLLSRLASNALESILPLVSSRIRRWTNGILHRTTHVRHGVITIAPAPLPTTSPGHVHSEAPRWILRHMTRQHSPQVTPCPWLSPAVACCPLLSTCLVLSVWPIIRGIRRARLLRPLLAT